MRSQASEQSHGKERVAQEADKRKVIILMADDDDEDCMLFQEALEESSLKHDLLCFANGKKLMDYLGRCGEYQAVDAPQPDLIILDLNMPVKDGRTTLQEIKKDPELKDIHVMVLTESREEADIMLCYNLGAETFFTKEEWFKVLVEVVRTSGEYWFSSVCPGTRKKGNGHFHINRKKVCVGDEGVDSVCPLNQ